MDDDIRRQRRDLRACAHHGDTDIGGGEGGGVVDPVTDHGNGMSLVLPPPDDAELARRVASASCSMPSWAATARAGRDRSPVTMISWRIPRSRSPAMTADALARGWARNPSMPMTVSCS